MVSALLIPSGTNFGDVFWRAESSEPDRGTGAGTGREFLSGLRLPSGTDEGGEAGRLKGFLCRVWVPVTEAGSWVPVWGGWRR